MMLKKREFLILVVLLFSLLYSSSVLAGWIGDCAGDKCTAIVVGTKSCVNCDLGPLDAKGTYSLDCNNNEDWNTQCQAFGSDQGQDLQIMVTSSKYCKFGPSIGTNQGIAGGCYFVAGDKDPASNPDDCAYGRVAPATKWGYEGGTSPYGFVSDPVKLGDSSGSEDDAFGVLENSYISGTNWEYLCDDDGFWSKCVQQSQLTHKTVANGVAYECTYANGIYQWVSDKDGDGYTTSEDCQDDMAKDPPICGTVTKEIQDASKGKQVTDIRQIARGVCANHPDLYSTCAVCINSGAAEVCGDGINNDCGGPGQWEKDIHETGGATLDSCDLNQASCQQGIVGHCSQSNKVCSTSGDCDKDKAEQCILPGEKQEEGTCGLIAGPPVDSCKKDLDCGTQGKWSCYPTGNGGKGLCQLSQDQETKLCKDDSECGVEDYWQCNKASVSAKNVYNKEFDWKDTAEGGYCCGFHGVSDAGKIITGKDNSGSFVCLNNAKTGENKLVSTEKGFAQENKPAVGLDDIFKLNNCKDNWCFVSASQANSQFKVITVKKPGDTPFDVVSNGNEWMQCDAQAEKTFTASEFAEDPEKQRSNRFYCYWEGNRWSWAECAEKWDQRENPSVKGRYPGEGLYTLPLALTEDVPDQPEKEKDYIRQDKVGSSVSITYDKLYKNYYGQGFLDFTDYNDLNFMVKFVKNDKGDPAKISDLKLPLKLNLKIFGPKIDNKPIVYFDGDVLGDVINKPFSDLPHEFMQVQVPIKSNYKAISGFTISTGSENLVEVRNIYLTSTSANIQNQLCTGEDVKSSNNWIKDVDAGDPDAAVTGENICKQLYGGQAWLGNDKEVSEKVPSANCCGNAQNEYYSGSSKEFVPKDANDPKKANYACWNSQSIASGDSIMDVEFQVTSQQPQFDVKYDLVSLENVAPVIHYRAYDPKDIENPNDDIVIDGSVKCTQDSLFPLKLEEGDTAVTLCNLDLNKDVFDQSIKDEINKIINSNPNNLNKDTLDALKMLYDKEASNNQNFRGITKFWVEDPLTDSDSPVELLFYDTIDNSQVGELVKSGSFKTDKDDPVDTEEKFKVNGPAQYITKGNARNIWNHPISVVARLKAGHYFKITPSSSINTESDKKTYACSSSECLFPLPGNPPYKVTNLHPDLYDLYYVTGSQEKDETPITKADQEFSQYANIKAKRIAQQVVYYNEGENSKLPIGFYGCSAADYLSHVDYNKQSCTVVASKFCSPSVIGKEENNKDEFTVVNSWSGEGLTMVGYDTASLKKPEGQNISAYYEQLQLTLKKKDIPATQRNHSTSAPPARNFISNPEFTTSAKKIPYWEIFSSGQPVADEHTGYVVENKVMLKSTDILRSERIAVPTNTDLYFSAAQKCTTNILLVDKNGKSTPVDPDKNPQFNTGAASYIIIEFTGACEIEKPLLQVVDSSGPIDYASSPYQSHPELPNPDARSGAACCPDKYCWNGYACVEPMSTLTTITEHVADGRDYRCVDGSWKRSLLKFDWNNQQWGFCPQESQCFVLGSGKAENTAQTFTDGKSPICINNGEYIMDNYCTQGNWTSRTKYLATKLLEVAQNNEYVLYCAPYQEALLDLGNNDNYLGGPISVTQTAAATLPQNLKQPKAAPKTISTCYKLDADGKRLVPDTQNTCINNVCVLKYKEGGAFKVAFATTLNKKIDDPKSFLLSLNVPQEKLSQICQGSGNDFIQCDLSGLEFPQSADMYYNKDLNAVIYARDGISLTPGVVDKVLNWFKNLFGSGPLAEKQFVTQAQNFRNVYIANVGGKKVRAAEEIFPKVKQTLVAEYQNFDTPVCDYVKSIKVPPELQLELLEEASGVEKVFCSINGTTQTVVVNAGLDFFWPQLTGKLRIGGN